MTESVLVTGGTGTLGSAVVERLLTAGHDAAVLSRHPAAAATTESPAGARWHVGDLRTGAGLDDALASAGVVIHCATSGNARDVEASRILLDAARRAGNPHLIYISIVGIDQVPLGYYRAKLEVEHLVESSGLPWTVLRATQFHEFVLRFFTLQRRSPLLLVPAQMPVQPIDVGEVADRLVELAGEQSAGRVTDIGGPEVRQVAEFARSYRRATGSRRPVVAVPVPGKTMGAFRRGGHLATQHATGRRNFDEFLAEALAHPGSGTR